MRVARLEDLQTKYWTTLSECDDPEEVNNNKGNKIWNVVCNNCGAPAVRTSVDIRYDRKRCKCLTLKPHEKRAVDTAKRITIDGVTRSIEWWMKQTKRSYDDLMQEYFNTPLVPDRSTEEDEIVTRDLRSLTSAVLDTKAQAISENITGLIEDLLKKQIYEIVTRQLKEAVVPLLYEGDWYELDRLLAGATLYLPAVGVTIRTFLEEGGSVAELTSILLSTVYPSMEEKKQALDPLIFLIDTSSTKITDGEVAQLLARHGKVHVN